MRSLLAVLSLSLIAAAPTPSPDAKLRAIVAPVSGSRMKATVARLVSFGTRHTLSSQTDPKRGIGASLGWTKAQFESFGLPSSTASVRQLLGRPGEVWGAESGVDKIVVIRHPG